MIRLQSIITKNLVNRRMQVNDINALALNQTTSENAINTYFSSRTEALTGILLNHLPNNQQRLEAPFTKTHIVVPNSGMQRYLELSIAEKFGICSHIEMSFASRFLKSRYKQVLPKNPPSKYIDTRHITFAIISLWSKNKLPSVFDNTQLPILLKQYSSAKQRYYLAEHIAQLFAQYLNERPELISIWQRGGSMYSDEQPHEEWQMHLFNELALSDFSGTDIQQQFHRALTAHQYDLPDVHLFGFHAMPPVQLADFAALSSQSNVYAYIFNPSVTYWRDIVPASIKMERALTAESEAALMSVGNPLLATWGQSGKYLIEELNESINQPIQVDEFLQEEGIFDVNSVLTWAQSMIRELGDQDENINSTKDQLQNSDKLPNCDELPNAHTIANQEINEQQCSISLHAGASPRREIEILYDNLCELFANNRLNPSDVLVMVPNLRDYAPHIQSIFGADPTHSIPFSLANQTAAEADPNTQAFLALVNMINNDFSAQCLFDVISEERIRDTYNVSLSDIETIRYWLIESQYAQHFHDNSNGRAGSLEKLLDALLLACIGGDECRVTFNDKCRSALPSYQNSQRESLLVFCQIISQLAQFTRLTHKHQTITEWRDTLVNLAHDFLGENNNITPRLQQWHKSVIASEDSTSGTNIENIKFDYDSIITDIIALLENEELHGPFLSGGISFCAMVPMRSIPAKMICLLGLNQTFPRLIAKDPLDLRHAHPLWSDRDINKEYKYFFLETLMAARERLYLSHVGKDDKTGETIPPSIVVDELFAFINRHCPNYSHSANNEYPLQGFLNTKKTYQSLYKKPLKTENSYPHVDNTNSETKNHESTPTLPTQLHFRFIADSLCEPLNLYVNKFLSADTLDIPESTLAEHDMVAIDSGLDNWRYKESLIQSELFGADATNTLIQQNKYPPAPISQPLIESARNDITPMIEHMRPWVANGYRPESRFIESNIDDIQCHILWESQYVSSIGQWNYSAGSQSAKKTLRAWVSHVLQGCIDGLPNYHSYLFTLDKSKITQMTFRPFDNVGVAQSALAEILSCFEHIFYTPYAATLEKASKKSDDTFIYKAKRYPLFPNLSDQGQLEDNSEIIQYFAPINKTIKEYMIEEEVK
ncbi:MAG: exodeoxyribonuclease V subunit gamma [Gammaproteobacteria bacterium]|nr:exodeoxyribonuclease V subunit gamma [Gammaproteobacteria bacterium]